MSVVVGGPSAQSIDGDETQFQWEGLAYHATRTKVSQEVRPSLPNYYLAVLGGMVIVCLHRHRLSDLIEDISPDTVQSPAEEEADLREKISECLLVTAYLHPLAQRETRAVEIANELGIPAFVVYDEHNRENLPRKVLSLPNIRERVALTTGYWESVNRMADSLSSLLNVLKTEIIAKRAASSAPSPPDVG